MRFLTAPVMYALLVVCLLLALATGVQSYRLKGAQASGIACQADRVNFAATQTGNLLTIEDLSHRLAVLAEARKVEQDAAASAIKGADTQAQAAESHAAAITHELEGVYARDTHAQAWGAGGVDAAVAAKLPHSP